MYSDSPVEMVSEHLNQWIVPPLCLRCLMTNALQGAVHVQLLSYLNDDMLRSSDLQKPGEAVGFGQTEEELRHSEGQLQLGMA